MNRFAAARATPTTVLSNALSQVNLNNDAFAGPASQSVGLFGPEEGGITFTQVRSNVEPLKPRRPAQAASLLLPVSLMRLQEPSLASSMTVRSILDDDLPKFPQARSLQHSMPLRHS